MYYVAGFLFMLSLVDPLACSKSVGLIKSTIASSWWLLSPPLPVPVPGAALLSKPGVCGVDVSETSKECTALLWNVMSCF
jgi:hypothetical protein